MKSGIPIDDLKRMVGVENIKIDSEKVVVTPENSSAVSEIVKLANLEKFKILPLGSGSLLDRSEVCSENILIVKSEKMNRVKRIVPEDLYVIVQAGFPLKDLNPHLEQFNLFYPVADNKSSGTIGGVVATNLKGRSGEKALQTRDYVLSLEVIDPEGQIVNVGARTFKSVTGYDLVRLFVGSWGTLGFITQISLRLIPARKRKYYPSFAPEPAIIRCESRNHKNGLKMVLSSRIKRSLDPHQIFPNFDSLARKRGLT